MIEVLGDRAAAGIYVRTVDAQALIDEAALALTAGSSSVPEAETMAERESEPATSASSKSDTLPTAPTQPPSIPSTEVPNERPLDTAQHPLSSTTSSNEAIAPLQQVLADMPSMGTFVIPEVQELLGAVRRAVSKMPEVELQKAFQRLDAQDRADAIEALEMLLVKAREVHTTFQP